MRNRNITEAKGREFTRSSAIERHRQHGLRNPAISTSSVFNINERGAYRYLTTDPLVAHQKLRCQNEERLGIRERFAWIYCVRCEDHLYKTVRTSGNIVYRQFVLEVITLLHANSWQHLNTIFSGNVFRLGD